MPYFPDSGGRKHRMKENQTSAWDKSATRAHIDCVTNFRTARIRTGIDTARLAQCAWCYLRMHISVCVQEFLSVLVPEGSSLEEDKLRVGKKSSSLEMTAVLSEFFHAQTGVFRKFESRKINWCLGYVCPLMRSCFDTAQGRVSDLIANNKGCKFV